MDRDDILAETSWDEDRRLALAEQFITAKGLWEEFQDFLMGAAEEESKEEVEELYSELGGEG